MAVSKMGLDRFTRCGILHGERSLSNVADSGLSNHFLPQIGVCALFFGDPG